MRLWLALALVLAQGAAAETVDLTLENARIIARQAYAVGEMGVANALARRLLEANPHDAQALLILAATEPALGNPTAGRLAGRKAWAAAETPLLRYEIARHTAAAALQENRPGLAQFWLRRAADVAPSANDYARTVADYRRMRAENPVSLQFDLAIMPSSNLNGGGQGGVLEIDGQIVNGFYNRSLPPLSGMRAEAQAEVNYRLATSPRSQTTLGFSLSASLNALSAEARALNLNISGAEFNQTTAEASLSHDFLWPGGTHPLHLALAAGQNWSGGAVLGPHLRLDAATPLWRDGAGELRLAGSVERQWQPNSAVNSGSLALMAQRRLGSGASLGGGIYLRQVNGTGYNQDYRDASAMLTYALAQPIGPVALSGRLTVGLRDYDVYRLGFAQLTQGRHDQRLGLSVDLTLQNLGVWGYAPVISLTGSQTQSNVNWFDSRQLGVSIGFESKF